MRRKGTTTWLLALFAAAAMTLPAISAYAQTTGTIEGTVVDENGQAVPGVTVEVNSPSMQGTKVAVTGTDGRFRQVLLPPGVYTLRASLEGYATTEQTEITVGLGRIVTVHVTMHSAFKEEVVVTGEAPLVDVRSTEVSINVTADAIEKLPTGRNYASVTMIMPGVQSQYDPEMPDGISVYGSSGAENAYYIDGVNTTGVELAVQGKQLNFEFIQELQVKAGGYMAEFGRATGGMINVITKSGGNEFSGDLFAYYDIDSLRSDFKSDVVDAARVTRSYLVDAYTRQDFGINLGGPIVKDKLWFWAAYDRVDDDEDQVLTKDFTAFGGPPIDTVYVASQKRDLWAGKVTWRLGQNHTLIASGFADPNTSEGPIETYPIQGPETTFSGIVDQGGTDYTAKYEGVLGQSVVIGAQYAKHKEKYDPSASPGFAMIMSEDYTYTVGGARPRSGGLGFTNVQEFGRETWRADVAMFAKALGDHEFKAGVEWESIDVLSEQYDSGGQRIRIRCQSGTQLSDPVTGDLAGCAPGGTYYQHEFYMTTRPPNVNVPNMADYVADSFPVTSGADNYSAFLQDSWRISPKFTLNLGVRYDNQKLYDSAGATNADLKDYSPRIGFVWDWSGTGASKLYGSWGYIYETIPMDMVIRSFGGEITALTYNRTADGSNVNCEPESGFRSCRIVGGGSTPVDPDMKGQYIEEAIIGADLEVAKDFVLGAKYIWRDLPRVIEDSLGFDQNYYLGNPGTGYLSQMWDESYTYQYAAPKPKRTFTGVELSARKRFSNNWQFLASYLWSELKGNYDGTFQASTGQLDPNLNSAFDYAEFTIQNDGYLSLDRTHQFKFDGYYTFDFGLDLGLSVYYITGKPVTAFGYDVSYRNYEYYLSERGAYGRTDDQYEMSLHLGYPIKLGGRAELALLADVFNLLNVQGETDRDMRFNLDQSVDVINYDTGEVNPLLPGGTTCASLGVGACNPNFNKANTFQDPRSIRLGVRLSF
jgi:outer membrane receptor protein involved in Fe transport